MIVLAGVFAQGHALYAVGPGLFVAVFALIGVVPVLAGELVADRRSSSSSADGES